MRKHNDRQMAVDTHRQNYTHMHSHTHTHTKKQMAVICEVCYLSCHVSFGLKVFPGVLFWLFMLQTAELLQQSDQAELQLTSESQDYQEEEDNSKRAYR